MTFTPAERKFLLSLNTPQKIQGFLDQLPVNFEPEGDTCLSPVQVLRQRRAHCIEAAAFAAMVLELHGEDPLLLDLTANRKDQDHVLALFKRNGCWGAIAKSNHHCLGYRDPVYKSIRELVMSYFHEYLNTSGEKTLRSYSSPLNLRKFKEWKMKDDIWPIAEHLAKMKHTKILTKQQERLLRHADTFTATISNMEREVPPSLGRKTSSFDS